jgi:hypothetical protein
MRSNFNPYPQKDEDDFNKLVAELQLKQNLILLAIQQFNETAAATVPLLVKHHTKRRLRVQHALKDLRQTLHSANIMRAQAMDAAYTTAMTDVEILRGDYHDKIAAEKAQEAVEREEKRTLAYDEDTGRYSVLRRSERVGPDGTMVVKREKVVISPDHKYLK